MKPNSLRAVLLPLAVVAFGEVLQLAVYRGATRFIGGSDFILYAEHSEALLRGRCPSMIWKPIGTGAWLAGYRAMFGDGMAGFAMFNAVALGLLPFLAYIFASSLAGRVSGVAAALFVAMSPAFATNSVLGETPATFFLAMALAILARNHRAGRQWVPAIAAICFILAWLCRPDTAVYIVGSLALAGSASKNIVERFSMAAVFALCAAVLVLCVALYNQPRYGRASPVRYDSYLRFIRVFDTGRSFKIDPADADVDAARNSVASTGHAMLANLDGTSFLGWDQGFWVIRQSLAETTGSYARADEVMARMTMRAIRNDPSVFLSDTIRTFRSFTAFRAVAGAFTFQFFEARKIARWTKAPSDPDPTPREREIALRLYHEVRAARFESSYNSWDNPYNERFMKLVAISPWLIYPLIVALVLSSHGIRRWQFLALITSVFMAFLAYAVSGFFDYRYLLNHSWSLWTLAGMGLAAVGTEIVSRRSRLAPARQPPAD